jgi:hypothetical protein
MANSVVSIAIDKLTAHPGNANRMSKANFAKLVRNIERTGRYEPLIVRPEPKRDGFFQIINGHHRCEALKKLGFTKADCIVWDVDDGQTDILLATLNRLCGTDEAAKKIALVKRLSERLDTKHLAKLLPYPQKQIQRLATLENSVPAILKDIEAKSVSLAKPLVFFVTDNQKLIIERALALAMLDAGYSILDSGFEAKNKRGTKAAQRAEALCTIAQSFINQKVN